MRRHLLALLDAAPLVIFGAARGFTLLPHGAGVGDTFVPVRDDGSSGRVPLQIHIPFFGEAYSALWVNTNGIVSFQDQVTQYTPQPFPLPGRPLVAPFWADVDIRAHGSVSYRETINAADLSAAQALIDDYVPAFRGFQVEMAFVATWLDVAAFGVGWAHIKNSFQCVLMTDGRWTLAAFLYDEIVWTTGTASGGNSTGLGGTPAQVGFDSGDGTRHHAISVSRTDAVLQLPQLSNVDTPGLFVYRIDGSTFGTGNICEQDSALGVTPLYDSPAGGQVLTVSTAKECLNEMEHDLACVFNMSGYRLVVPATYVTPTAVWCIAPPMERLGLATLGLSTDGGNTTTLSTGFFFLDQVPGKVTVEIGGKLVGSADPVLLNHDQIIQLSWLASEAEGEELDLLLVAIGGDGVQDYHLVARAVPNNGTLLILAGDISASVEGNPAVVPMLAFDFVLVPQLLLEEAPTEAPEVSPRWRKLRGSRRLKEPRREDTVQLLVPAVRYTMDDFLKALSKAVGQVESAALAVVRAARVRIASILKVVDRGWREAWDLFLDYDFSALEDVCVPCTSQQAALNEQDWEVDAHCPDKDHCDFHPGSDICYRQRVPNADGSCWQVCYMSMENSYQLLDGKVTNINPDPAGAGTADRVCGSASSVLHAFWDGMPYVILRDTQQGKYLKMYNEHRPQPDAAQCCEDVPQPAAARGDPHFNTLDGLWYTFNGLGEFWLLRSENAELDVQVRTEEVLGVDLAATVFTAFVVKTSASPAVQVSFLSYSRETLLVLADGEVQTFDDILTTREFGDVSVVVHPGEELPRVTVRVSRRLVLDIRASSGALAVVAGASTALLNATVGLLGIYDGVAENDLTTPEGTVIPTGATSRQLHYDFGLSWMLQSANESLFKYRGTQTFESTNNRSYVPIFLDDILSGGDTGLVNDTSPEATLCGGNLECLFDLKVTGDVEFANATLTQTQQFTEVVEVVHELRQFTAPTTTMTTTMTTPTSTTNTTTWTSTSTTTPTTTPTSTTHTQTTTSTSLTATTPTQTLTTATQTATTPTTTATNTTTSATSTTSTSTTSTSTTSTSTTSTSTASSTRTSTSRTTTTTSTSTVSSTKTWRDFESSSHALRSPQLTTIQYVILWHGVLHRVL